MVIEFFYTYERILFHSLTLWTLFLLHIICIMFGGVSDHLVLLLLINLS